MNNGTASTRGFVVDAQEATPGSGDATYATGEAAQALGLSSSSVRKMIASGELAARRDQRGRHRIPREAVRAKLKQRGFTPPAGGASEGSGEAGGTEESRDDGGLLEEVGDVRRELQRLGEEVGALRGELLSLARSAQEDKERTLEERGVLQEERARLLEELEGERRRADELAQELETFKLKWWARETG